MEPILVLVVAAVVVAVALVVVLVVRRRRRSLEVRSAAAVGLATRLARSRRALGEALRDAFGRGAVDDAFWDSLEEALIGADVGVRTAADIVGRVREARPADPLAARDALHRELVATLGNRDRGLHLEGRPAVVMVVGVNGVGKTTSIAKLSARLLAEGRKPLLGAADTFRAAADTQLRVWAERVGVGLVGGSEGADPAAVAFDSYRAAKARGNDVLIVDTAGRLHSRTNLMAELEKMGRVLQREAGRIDEVLLVLDATAGQNGAVQAARFAASVEVTGIVLTKLDGTGRGGIVVAVEQELGVPVKLIGVGEGIDDLLPFEPEAFVDALLEGV